jgi:hypothetical protein
VGTITGKHRIDQIADKAARLAEANDMFQNFLAKAKSGPVSREEFVTFVAEVSSKLADAGDIRGAIMAAHMNPHGGPDRRR